MRKATEREEQFFRRVEQHPAFQFFAAFFALVGFTVTTGFVITQASGMVQVGKTVALILVGMAAGYFLRWLRE